MGVCGVSKDACAILSSYLSDRYKRVKISHCRNSWALLTKGIPQSSGLVQYLLNVCMNDIFYIMEICNLVNYADVNILRNIRSTIQIVLSALKTDVEDAMLWFQNDFMQANAEDFQLMFMEKYTNKETISVFIETNYTKK